LLAEAETSAVYFLRTEAADAGRLDLFPALHLPFTPFPWLTSTTSVGVRETAYTTAGPPGGATNRLLADLGQRFGSTFLRRFEQPGFGFSRLTHVVESGLQYQYVPWTDQQSLPQFDRVDFINPQNRLTYRVANRLMGRTEPARGEVQTYEVASLVVAQSLNLQPKTREFSDLYLEGLTPERVDQAVTDLQPLENGFTRASERRWSNLVLQGGFRPLPRLALQATVSLNVEHPEVEGVNSGLEVQLADTLTISAGQSYIRDQQVDGVVAKILWKATQNVALDLLTRYDIRTSVLLENTAILRYSSCCWEVALKYTHRTRGSGQSDENSVQVNFDLKVPTSVVAR
jgi:lipopolysaccharide assembly outer membrane protein LptD (OstA)